MHPILQRSLIFIVLVVAGLVLYVLMFGMDADKYNETAIPYLNKTLPKLSNWKYSELKPMLSPKALAEFETDKGKAVYRLFTRLGKLESIGKPQYIGDKSVSSSDFGEVDLVSYTVPVVFETGPAEIKIILASNGQSYSIHHLRINSAIYIDLQE
ncbi:MAG: hypothetical protein V3R76_11670 [Gammaproteobacteria bacterium]